MVLTPPENERPAFFARPPWLTGALVVGLLLAGLLLRLYDLDDPPLDFHPTRQIHSAILARGFYAQQSDQMPAEQRQLALQQLQAEAIIEPPLLEGLSAWAYSLLGREDLRVPRLLAIACWMAGAIALWLLAREWLSPDGQVVSLAYFLFWPYGVIASRSFQPDPLMIALILFAVWAGTRWAKRPNGAWRWALLAGLLGGSAILVKSVAVFFVLGAFAALALLARGRRAWADPQLWGMGVLCVLPYAAYHIYGVYLAGFLQSQFSQRFFPQYWGDIAFYLRWFNVGSRVTGFECLFAGVLGLAFLKDRRHRTLLLGLWLGYLGLGLALSHHISTHDYYSLPLLPLVALGLGALAEQLLPRARARRGLAAPLIVGVLLVSLVLKGYEARNLLKRADYRPAVSELVELGRELGPTPGLVCLSADYGASLSYYGWMTSATWSSSADQAFQQSLGGESPDFAAQFEQQTAGRNYFLVLDRPELELQPELKKKLQTYPLLRQSATLLLYDLRGK